MNNYETVISIMDKLFNCDFTKGDWFEQIRTSKSYFI